ncbi:MAG TPA: site-specific integrase [Syntrophothermus lipocalidus]|nr:site-specific integrase [Syntrophothermus lipocalidus]
MARIEKRGKKYRVVWDTGTPDNRKRRIQSFDTFAEAKQFKARIELELSTGTYVEPAQMTFGQYLDHWLALHGDKLAPKTLDSYQCEIKNHIKPHLGSIKLSKLSPMHLQDYYVFMLREGKTDGTGGLSPTTVNYHHRLIHKALEQAVKWQMVARNVADAVEPPRPERKQINYLHRDEVNRFINCIKESPDYPIIATAILTGMRRGEILGLRWQDINFEKGLIHVRQQLQYIQGQGYFFKTPKQHSIRDIPMPLPLNAIFRSIRKQQAEIKAIYEQAARDSCKESQYTDLDLVFCRYDGRPLNPSGLTRRFQALLKQHGCQLPPTEVGGM